MTRKVPDFANGEEAEGLPRPIGDRPPIRGRRQAEASFAFRLKTKEVNLCVLEPLVAAVKLLAQRQGSVLPTIADHR